MREDAQAAPIGPSPLRTYGPALGALALALPAIIMAKGRAGRELGDILKKFAPEHFKRLNQSEFPFMLTREPSPYEGPMHTILRQDYRPSLHDVLNKAPDRERLFKDAERYLGKRPGWLSHINVPEDYDPVSSGMHEFGHAVGTERMLAKYPQANPIKAARVGALHYDVLDNPESRKIIQNAMQMPEHRAYFAGRAATEPDPSHVYPAMGELLNDIWAQRMIKRGGGTWESITKHPTWEPSAREAYRNPTIPGLVAHVANTGALPEPHYQRQLTALTQLLESLQASRPSSPTRPSPTASPGVASGQGLP